MKFPAPLHTARLVRRYKRFLADVVLDATGEEVTAHCANPGAMLGLAAPGARVWLSLSDDPKRKLKWSWEIVEADGGLVGINTAHPNGLVAEAILAGAVPELAGYAGLRREVKYGRASRVDILLEDPARPPAYVEVKNVHLMRTAGRAEFPDSVTTRGARHLDELGDMVEAGARAVMVYLVQRTDCAVFTLAGDVDPAYAAAFRRARDRGVEAIALACRIGPDEIAVDRAIPIEIA
ncbi:DNA/RNA nuclease SfsA [Oharaeibacter diazotrophicus]|uniref:Sugar fermentation stimulation protein homolog n=1 Tax=Oharaeibacter diazotrophicus TaxID=1920512 RepID=A0A4R6RM12_9HYPH|nr:DNA/RNA nuclease SfsA [Oharaeibacter diazotrophicus]TDP87562.1 sugar fermentation stimulation protein A [Oharaeibacter diazotrophicus]BBE70493.1 sugar fermentation stimulation protein A [Pleomorphomonas sp. SM30]GLS77239.1 sugar fermentation stimulation protein [Oharaeibacter diazotrophicus]